MLKNPFCCELSPMQESKGLDSQLEPHSVPSSPREAKWGPHWKYEEAEDKEGLGRAWRWVFHFPVAPPLQLGSGEQPSFSLSSWIFSGFLRAIAIPSAIPVTKPFSTWKSFLGWVSFLYCDFSDIKERNEVISSCTMNHLQWRFKTVREDLPPNPIIV